MAIIGASKPMFAKYHAAGGSVSYSDGGVMGKLVEFNIELESTNNNDFYADNGVAETQRNKFSSGSITIQTDDLRQEVSKAILGLKEVTLSSIPGITGSVKELVFDDDQNTPYLGIGMIQKKQIDNIEKWRAIVLRKVSLSIPADAATTEGEEIDWQTPELSGTIMRDDSEKHAWKSEATFATEAEAQAYIRYKLSIAASSNANLENLTIVGVELTPDFAAGTTSYTATTSDANNIILASAEDVGATVAITANDEPVNPGEAAAWSTGENELEVVVTAASGATKTYTVTVTKE